MCNEMKNILNDKQELATCNQIYRIDSLHTSNSDALCIEHTKIERYEKKISKIKKKTKKTIKTKMEEVKPLQNETN